MLPPSPRSTAPTAGCPSESCAGGERCRTGGMAARKLRRRRGCSMGRYGVAEQACAGPPTTGCSAELTEVHFDNEVWWTFSLEATDSPNRQLHDLRQTARHLRHAFSELVELKQGDSMSYVEWLTRSRRPVA